MADSDAAVSQESATDLQAEWDRLDAEEAGGLPEQAPDAGADAEAAGDADDQGQASRPPADTAADQQPAGDVPDIWANAPAELRDAFQAERNRMEQAARSASGRAQAEARRNAELLAEIEALKKQAPQQQEEEAQPVITDEQKAHLREEYPDVAAPLLDVIGQLEKQVATLAANDASQAEQRTAAQQLEQQRHYAAEEQRLSEAHGDWKEVTAQPAFAEWVKTQPRMYQEALVRNANAIVDATEAGEIITRYKEQTAKPDELQARRTAQMRGSKVPQAKPFAPTPSTSTDKESEWERLDRIDRQREAQTRGAMSNR